MSVRERGADMGVGRGLTIPDLAGGRDRGPKKFFAPKIDVWPQSLKFWLGSPSWRGEGAGPLTPRSGLPPQSWVLNFFEKT